MKFVKGIPFMMGLMVFITYATVISCKKGNNLPAVTTSGISGITQTNALSGGNVTDDGGSTVSSRGVCWNITGNPTIADRKTIDGIDKGLFTSNITGLTPQTKYFVKAYATNASGTGYGDEVTFTTLDIGVATVITSQVSSISTKSAVSGGNIISDGGSSITAKGVCYGLSPAPDISGLHTTETSTSSGFSSALTDLTPGSSYYVRAYATNSKGTAYGNEVSFTTLLVGAPLVSTTEASFITAETAASGGNIIDDNGASVTARGVCWSTHALPTLSDQHTEDGTGSGSFSSILSGLEMATEYHLRAYATNSEGTSYGDDKIFITMLKDADNNLYNIIDIGSQTWMAENLKTTKFNDGTPIPYAHDKDLWMSFTTPGYCWYNYDEGTYKNLYGGLYNFYTVVTGKLCPSGWHVPESAEWTKLTTYLGGDLVSGGKMKTTGTLYWKTPNEGATNESGFGALPAGDCLPNGTFEDPGNGAYFWSASDSWYLMLTFSTAKALKYQAAASYGFSIRCVKD